MKKISRRNFMKSGASLAAIGLLSHTTAPAFLADSSTNNATSDVLTTEEICAVFPEIVAFIEEPSVLRSPSEGTRSAPQIVFSSRRISEDNMEYSVLAYDDGSIKAARAPAVSFWLEGGSTSTSTSYTENRNVTVQILEQYAQYDPNNYYYATSTYTITGVTYRIYPNNYDQITAYPTTAIQTKTVTNSPVTERYTHALLQYNRTQNSSGPAIIDYGRASSDRFAFLVYDDNWHIELNGTEF